MNTSISNFSGPATPGRPKGNKEKNRKRFKAETIKRVSPRSKYYCFSHSRASRIQKLVFNVPLSLHFEIHFSDPVFKSFDFSEEI